jgi:hypothetical protein
MNSPAPDPKVSIIEAVRTPLAFLVLGFLVVDGNVTVLATTLPEYRALLVGVAIVSIPLFVATVVALAIWRPEALQGVRPLQTFHANQFAINLFLVLDGPLRNLKPAERSEAWMTLADVITADGQSEASYSKFCKAVALKLQTLTNLPLHSPRTPGPITPASS